MSCTRRVCLLWLTALCLAPHLAAVGRAQTPSGDAALRARLTETAERILLPDRCAECHAAAFEVWEDTEHATGFDTLHRSDRAKEIYRSLGLRLIKRGTDETTPACLACHYTPVLRRAQLRAGAGVTCESCHGASREWISIHNGYGVPEADFQKAALLETAEHRAQRVADSVAAGMRRPSELYEVAANCFACHTVPNEELVNRAGHSTGSDFELVNWSGRIRHNFLESYLTADGRTNAERPLEWKRVMYVVGRALDLEYALRGVAAATEDELYFGAMSDRAGAAVDELFEINDRVAIPAVQTIIAAWESADLALNNSTALLTAADAIQRATREFVGTAEGTALASLDPLWDPTIEEVARPARTLTDVAVAPASVTAGDVDRAPSSVEAAADPSDVTLEPLLNPPLGVGTATPSAPSDRPSAPRPAPAREQLPPHPRPAWRETPTHDFVKVPCGRCHNAQEKWWRRDPHSESAKPFRANNTRHVEIAEAYGIAASDMARGNQTCMWCHGTIVSAPTRKVRAGVGCQRCHGPGADYLEPHATASHAESVAFGLTDLRDPAIQAATCAGCHYITDSGLINAGHPTGAEFDIGARVDIVHWGDAFGREATPVDTGALAVAHATVLAERGPTPARAAAPAPPSTRAVGTTAATPNAHPVGEAAPARPDGVGAGTAVAFGAGQQAGRTSPTRPPRSGPPRPARRRYGSAPATLVDDPVLLDMAVSADTSVEEALEVLKLRLEQLYRALGRPPR